MAGEIGKTKRKSLLEHAILLEEVARRYYINEHAQKKIGKDLDLANPAAVNRYLQEARSLGVISFSVDASFAIVGSKDASLTRNLRDAFELADATVIQVDLGKDDDERAQDDNLHKALANYAGREIRERIQPNEHIAVAGGRAIIQAVKAISRLPPARRGIHITPVCGRTWSHHWKIDDIGFLERPLDADDAAFILALAFEHERGVVYRQVAQPLYAAGADEAKK